MHKLELTMRSLRLISLFLLGVGLFFTVCVNVAAAIHAKSAGVPANVLTDCDHGNGTIGDC